MLGPQFRSVMPDTARPDPLLPPPVPARLPAASGLLPLQGMTLLAVEDSRFASEALRLMCQRSGARMRRADSLAAARVHLSLYRPDLVLVDPGLPDGSGVALIRSLVTSPLLRPAILGISGDPAAGDSMRAAGADGFLAKPVAGLSAFVAAVAAVIPGLGADTAADQMLPSADPMALIDDLRRAARHLQDPPGDGWLAGFLAGLARQSADPALAEAARDCVTSVGRSRLHSLLADRIAAAPAAFARSALPP